MEIWSAFFSTAFLRVCLRTAALISGAGPVGQKKVTPSPLQSLTPRSVYKVTDVARKHSHSFVLTTESTPEAPVSTSKISIFPLLCLGGNTLLGRLSPALA